SYYLQHVDLMESAEKQYSLHSSQSAVSPAFKVLAKGKLAQALARPLVRGSQEDWVAMIEEIDNETLLSSYGVSNAWLGPPWLKEGWFSSYLLLSGMLRDKAHREAACGIYQRLVKRG